jgi:hypothetical protein
MNQKIIIAIIIGIMWIGSLFLLPTWAFFIVFFGTLVILGARLIYNSRPEWSDDE